MPDLFVNVTTAKMFGGRRRIGYVRLSYEKGEMKKPGHPKWYDLQNPLNNINGTDPGKILLNA